MTDFAVINDDDLQTMFREGSSKPSRRYSDSMTGWWFQTFFIFHNIWDNPSHWLIFFKMVKTTNQMKSIPPWRSCKTFQMIRIWPWPPNRSIRSVMTFSQSEFTYDFNWPCRSFNSLAGCELTFSNTTGNIPQVNLNFNWQPTKFFTSSCSLAYPRASARQRADHVDPIEKDCLQHSEGRLGSESHVTTCHSMCITSL